jgi:hypothetical protein
MPISEERPEGGATIDGQFLVVRRADVTVRVRVPDVFHDLNDAERMWLAELVTWGPVMREACRRLASVSQSWDGDDWETREQWLLEVKAVHADEVASAKRSASDARGAFTALENVVKGIGRQLYEMLGDKLTDRQRAALLAAMHLDAERDLVPAGVDPYKQGRRMAFKEAREILFLRARALHDRVEATAAEEMHAAGMKLHELVGQDTSSAIPDVFAQREALARALKGLLALTGEQGMEANDAAFRDAEAALDMVPAWVLGESAQVAPEETPA